MRPSKVTPKKIIDRLTGRAGLTFLFISASLTGILSGLVFAYTEDLQKITALDDYTPNTITRIHASDGSVIGEFATERRSVIGFDDISPHLRNAILAVEDAQFNSHFGISMSRIVIAALKDLAQGRPAQGASTITQQLARNLAELGLNPREKTFERKIREAILALHIEKRYTKREIFTFYCNQIYLGHGAHGVEAAAHLYFNKPAKEITLGEAATIAALIQAPSRLSPFVNMERSQRRRDYVLNRMATENFVTHEKAEEAKQGPLVLHRQTPEKISIAPYFVEEIRKTIEATYGATALYESGLSVYSSLDRALQRSANNAVDNGLRQLDKRRGFRKPARNIIREEQDLETFIEPSWIQPLEPGKIVPAIVLNVNKEAAQLKIGEYRAELTARGFTWTRQKSPAQLFEVGDLLQVRVEEVNEQHQTAEVTLEQTPLVEGALIAIENRTGHVLAMVGGYDFGRSKFNRATQALRQLGSTFKAILYSAAIDSGYTSSSIIIDEPVTYDLGPEQPPYEPTNYDNEFLGPITLRRALEKSRNVPAVAVMAELGPESVVTYAQRFGFSSPLPPVLSLALGAGEASLQEITSAYSVFPNQGVRMRPYQILKVTDRESKVLEENHPEPNDVIRPDTAFILTNLLRGVVIRGTAIRAGQIDWPLAGKTGTVDDFTDASFIGFDPDITVGVWVGHDEKKPLGPNEEGARVALPIWIEFMKSHIALKNERPEFSTPGNIIFLSIDGETGNVTNEPSRGTITEAFIAGTEPSVIFSH
jgi:penicillin-binding protein 1A